MILKGSQRAGAAQLANHLINIQENDHVELYELRGFMSDNLRDALQEIHAVSRGTKCKQFMFSVSLNPPQNEDAPVEYFENALRLIEEKTGLQDQPRAIVFHEKEGRRHAHAVWSRIDVAQMKAINLPHYKLKLRDISKQLYLQYNWTMPNGFIDIKQRDPANFTLAEWQQSKRIGEKPKQIKTLFKECWTVSDGKTAFTQALKENGYILARGDRRGFVAVDYRGEIYSLSKWMGVKTKALKEKLGEPKHLPSVDQAKAEYAKRMTQRLKQHIHDFKEQANKDFQPFLRRKETLRKHHRKIRETLKSRQTERWLIETQERQDIIPRGLHKIWSWITGQHGKLCKQNEQEIKVCKQRDRTEKQEIIKHQLKERRNLQRDINRFKVRADHDWIALKQDIAHYIEMGGEPPSIHQPKQEQNWQIDYAEPEM